MSTATAFITEHQDHDVRRMWRTPRAAEGETPTYLFCRTCGTTHDVGEPMWHRHH